MRRTSRPIHQTTSRDDRFAFGCAILGAFSFAATATMFCITALLGIMLIRHETQAAQPIMALPLASATIQVEQLALTSPLATPTVLTDAATPVAAEVAAPSAVEFTPTPDLAVAQSPLPTPLPPTPDVANSGIIFGTPITLTVDGATTLAVLAQNTSSLVKSFSVRATYQLGGQVVATASGSVSDLLPGQTRAVTLTPLDAVPQSFDIAQAVVEMISAEGVTSAWSESARQQSFGAVTVEPGQTQLGLDVTNFDSRQHTYVVQVAYVQDLNLLGMAMGTVNALPPGQTQHVTLLLRGKAEGNISVGIESFVE